MPNLVATGIAAIAAGVTLLAISAAGALRGTLEHPLASTPELHKNGVTGASYDAVIAELASIEPPIAGREQLSRITTAFAKRIRHYWPAANTVDADVMYDWRDNWFMAARQRLEVAGSNIGFNGIDIARLERRDMHSILQKGVGLCSQAALGVADFLDQRGLPARIIPLGGHVVAHTSTGGNHYVLDADYNVTFEVPVSKPSQWAEIARKSYGDAGYSGQRLEKVVSIYSLSKAEPIEAWRYVQPWRRALVLAEATKWTVPFALMVVGGWLVARRRRTHSPSQNEYHQSLSR